MHPNWKALATLHIPLKRFVTEGTTEDPPSNSKQKKHIITNVSAPEVTKFYEEVIQTPETATQSKVTEKHQNIEKEPQRIPFDKTKFFRAAMANDADTIEHFAYQDNDINSTDAFGWTALMMAACEGAANTVLALKSLGANPNCKDKSGNTAFSLAEKKNFHSILALLSQPEEGFTIDDSSGEDQDIVQTEFFCDVCTRRFEETSLRDHVTSTVHQFNLKTYKPNATNRFNIPPKNRGLKIMLRQGWDKESGLGPTNNGRLFPVKTVIRKQRTGLGTQQNPARVTHFDAYDLRAIKYVPRAKTKNRNDIRREKHVEWKRERRLRRELS